MCCSSKYSILLSVHLCLFIHVSGFFLLLSFQMEDGQTLFDYNVGLNDIVQLLIRSQTDSPDSPAAKDSSGVPCSSAPPPDFRSESHSSPAPASPAAMETSTNIDNDSSSVTTSTVNETKPDTSATSNSASTKNGFKSSSPARDTQPPTSSRNTLADPGVGVYKVSVNIWEVFARNVLHATSLPEVLRQGTLICLDVGSNYECILCSTAAENSKPHQYQN